MNSNQAFSGSKPLIQQGFSQTSELEVLKDFCITPINELASYVANSSGQGASYKLIENHLETPHLSSCIRTTLKQLKISNPCARVVERCVMSLEENRCFDGGDYLVILVKECFNFAFEQLSMGLHRQEVIETLRSFLRLCYASCDNPEVSVPAQSFENISSLQPILLAYIEDILRAKAVFRRSFLYSLFSASPFLSDLIASAPRLSPSPAQEFFGILQLGGHPHNQSAIQPGIVLDCLPGFSKALSAQPMLHRVALFSCNVALQETDAKGTVLLSSAEELLAYSSSETSLLQTKLRALSDAGVSLVVTLGTVSPEASSILESLGVNYLEVSSKYTMQKISTYTRTPVLGTLAVPERLGTLCMSLFELSGDYNSKRTRRTLLECSEGFFYTFVVCSPVAAVTEPLAETVRGLVGSLWEIVSEVARGSGEAVLVSGLPQLLRNVVENVGMGEGEIGLRRCVKVLERVVESAADKGQKGVVPARVFRKVFELAEEAMETCLSVDSVFFGKPSGGPDMLAKRGEGVKDVHY